MRTRDMEVIIGSVVFLSVVILIGGAIWLGARGFRKDHYQLNVIFENVSGLEKGDPVLIAGVKVGQVSDVQLRGGGAIAVLSIQGRIRIPSDSEVYLQYTGVLGERAIQIVPGQQGDFLSHNDTVAGTQEIPFEKIVPAMTRLGKRLEVVMEAVLTEKNVRNFNQILEEAIATMSILRTTVEENRNELSQTMENLKGASTSVQGSLSASEEKIQTIITVLERNTTRFDTLSVRLDRASKSLDEIADKLNRGEGTLGKLLNEDQLYRTLNRTLSDVDSLVVDIRKQPKRYVHISLF